LIPLKLGLRRQSHNAKNNQKNEAARNTNWMAAIICQVERHIGHARPDIPVTVARAIAIMLGRFSRSRTLANAAYQFRWQSGDGGGRQFAATADKWDSAQFVAEVDGGTLAELRVMQHGISVVENLPL